MNDDKFSLKARRTTRIPLRMPVHLVVQREGRTRTLDGWTMIVNVHGARIECKQRLELEEEVLLQIPSNGKAQGGRVVWTASEANSNGNFEFGLELASPENLWGIGFPPSDWNMNRAANITEPVDPPVEKPPSVVSPESNRSATPPPSPVEVPTKSHAKESAAPPEVANEPTAPVNPAASGVGSSPLSKGLPPIVNLTAELSEWETAMNKQPSRESSLDHGGLQEPAGPMGTGVNLPEVGSQPGPAGLALAALALPPRETRTAAPASPSLGSAGSMVGPGPATDRLSAIFQELVESALQARLLGLAEQMAARMEARIAETEARALAHIEQQILHTVSSQSERLEKRAVEIVANQQQLLEQNVQKFLQIVEANTMHRQQEFLETSRRTMRNEVTEVMKSSKAQLEQEISACAPMAWTSLRQRIDEELPSIEKQFVEQCRTESQRLLAAQKEGLTRLCSQHMQETEQIGNQARQALLRHIVTELDQRRRLWIQDAEGELKELMAQNLHRTRQGLFGIVKELGESLLQQAYQEGDAPGEVSCGCSDSEEPPATERFDEAKFCSKMEATAHPL